VPGGKYVAAVSGGVDSMVLLDLLSNLPGVELVVAHFDHGIRQDSALDEVVVRKTAGKLGLAYEAGRGRLGPGASEEQARNARYKFLEKVKEKYGADAIITAHHQDDLIETAIINLIRGTGRRGLASIQGNDKVIRPLLKHSKTEIVAYAMGHQIEWREDETNTDQHYLRNYVRHNISGKLTNDQRKEILSSIDKVAKVEAAVAPAIDKLAAAVSIDEKIDRQAFISLPWELGRELIAHWLRRRNLKDMDKATVNRLDTAIRTSKPGTVHHVRKGLNLVVGAEAAEFKPT